MAGCVMGLVVAVIAAVFGLLRMTIMLMTTSLGSLAVGPDEAADRIADSWIEQANGNGVNIGYDEVTRGGAKVGAWIVLIFGWIVTIGVAYVIVSMIANG